ncbi:MAG TPA: LysR family transcriptional regulator [Anaeromyxobacteraceae bacterium]|nr:LysR family transcriptional regulator [Anaeromyxobacteraceae bacterium]
MAMVDPRKLETFRVVVQARKISSAAKLLNLSQPAVTAQIRALEEECGRALLQRTSKGVTPNAWGLQVLQAANQVHEVLDAVSSMVRAESGAGGEVELAASMTGAAYIVPQLVAGYRATRSPASFRLQVGNTARVVEWVADGRVPLGLIEGRTRSSRVHLERYLEDELVPVAAASVRAFRSISRAADLVRVPLLQREVGSSSRALVENALAQALGRRPLPSALQFGSNQSIKMAAVAGLGIAFVSRWSLRLELVTGELRILPISDLRIVRSFSWATASREPRGAAGRFLAWARRHPPEPP